ncbi:MAG: periplasmic heavy metal sensor [Cyclobacteriaceae bacterium]
MKKLIMLTFGLITSMSILAQRGPNRQELQSHKSGKERMAMLLELTAEQQTTIDALKTPHQKEMMQNKAQLQIAHASLKAELIKDNVDEKSREKIINEISDLQITMLKNRVEHYTAVRQVLDDDQKVKFDAMAHKMFTQASNKGLGGPRHSGKGHGR